MSENQEKNIPETEAAPKKENKSKTSKKEAALLSEIETLKEEMAKEKDTYLRLCAEYDNFRKRTAKEKADIYSNATSKVIEEILPVIDNFERAIAQSDDQGFNMIYTQFCEVLSKIGVTEMKAQGEKFDPNLHIAVMHIDDDNFPDNTVVDVFQKGYMLGDKVVRPACVKVAN